jgi:hypothetical protein
VAAVALGASPVADSLRGGGSAGTRAESGHPTGDETPDVVMIQPVGGASGSASDGASVQRGAADRSGGAGSASRDRPSPRAVDHGSEQARTPSGQPDPTQPAPSPSPSPPLPPGGGQLPVPLPTVTATRTPSPSPSRPPILPPLPLAPLPPLPLPSVTLLP